MKQGYLLDLCPPSYNNVGSGCYSLNSPNNITALDYYVNISFTVTSGSNYFSVYWRYPGILIQFLLENWLYIETQSAFSLYFISENTLQQTCILIFQ